MVEVLITMLRHFTVNYTYFYQHKDKPTEDDNSLENIGPDDASNAAL